MHKIIFTILCSLFFVANAQQKYDTIYVVRIDTIYVLHNDSIKTEEPVEEASTSLLDELNTITEVPKPNPKKNKNLQHIWWHAFNQRTNH